MVNIETILHKLASITKNEVSTLTSFLSLSLPELKQQTQNLLSRNELKVLYTAIQDARKESTVFNSRLLGRANPQLSSIIQRLNIEPLVQTRNYDEWFPDRTDRFVGSESVASMFSPAAYLTELYREAVNLHDSRSASYLLNRRPDLASVWLTQENMDEEVSTLSLSNELLFNILQNLYDKSYDDVLDMLSIYRLTGMTPYHLPYEAARQSILLQDPKFTAFSSNPDVAKLMDPASLLAIYVDISPEIYEILIEDISEENANDLIQKNFGDIDVELFLSENNLVHYYDLSYEELSSQFKVLLANSAGNEQHYINDQLMILMQETETTYAMHINRTYLQYTYNLNYAELIPQGGDKYLVNFSFNQGGEDYQRNYRSMEIVTKGTSKKSIYKRTFDFVNYEFQANKQFSCPVIIEEEKIVNNEVTLTITIYKTEWYGTAIFYPDIKFHIERYSLPIFILHLNKLIRLYQATGLAGVDIQHIMLSVYQNELKMDSKVLDKMFYVLHFQRQYLVNIDDALVLSNINIRQYSVKQQPSQFSRLFNIPLLNGQEFYADDASIDLTAGISKDYFRIGILKRAFQLTDTELDSLWKLVHVGKQVNFINSIKNLSILYRFQLLAKLHELNVFEFSLLVTVSPYSELVLADLSDKELVQFANFLGQYSEWLKKQQWSVSELYLMLTETVSTVLTPDIENLLTTLQTGVADVEWAEEELIEVAAPFIAASLQIDSAETAIALLQWMNQLQPQGLSFDDFMQLVRAETHTEAETEKLVGYCQVLGQLTLIVSNVGLTSSELGLAVRQPESFIKGQTFLPQDLSTLYALTRFHAWILDCGNYATEVLTALVQKKLSPELLALALELDTQTVKQALQQITAQATFFSDWKTVDEALQWIDVSEKLNITPAGVASLLQLNYIGDANARPSFSQWQAVSTLLQAGLNNQQTTQLHASLDESTSKAVTAYYLKSLAAPKGVITHDDLYQYLLIDNQVSAQVKTTRVAEAIASIQLYVNRSLNGMEEEIMEIIRSRQFFVDWERYNKRYSTWAGVSLLVYYPENYLDPTLRIGQTKMMDNLSQQISQTQLNSDTVEFAFNNYLTAFEEIANLNVVTAYHDQILITQGFIYFIGYSHTDPRRYYWRRLDLSKQNRVGQFPANAWSAWKEIISAMQPYLDFIRPVVFKTRLYVIWIEQHIEKNDDVTKNIIYYYMKLAYLQYDGGWSTPLTFDVTSYVTKIGTTLTNTTGLYCAEYTSENMLLIYFYKKQNDYSSLTVSGFLIASDMTLKTITTTRLNNLAHLTSGQLDRVAHNRVNNQTTEIREYDLSIVPHSKLQANLSVDFSMEEEVLRLDLTPEFGSNYIISVTDGSALGFCGYYNYTFEITSPKELVTSVNGREGCDGKFFLIPPWKMCTFYPIHIGIKDWAQKNPYVIEGVMRSENCYQDYGDGECKFVLTLQTSTSEEFIFFSHNENQAQYIQIGPYRTRLNTLFATQLIERANQGIDSALTLATQNLKEPTMGDGAYIRVILPIYDKSVHGDSRQAKITLSRGKSDDGEADYYDFWQGSLADTTQAVILFVPFSRLESPFYNVINFPYSITIGINFYLNCEKGKLTIGTLKCKSESNHVVVASYTAASKPAAELNLLINHLESVDFQGANALYFWEMFFYVPMMIFQRLLQEGNFTEAKRWLAFVWNPAGYVIEDELKGYDWNVRPLAESLSWNANPLDTKDPDAVAQNDPMHYKVYVFMCYLDWLLAQCDAAYINYTVESMNEAKMWCLQALDLLGEEPNVLQDNDWATLRLDVAADQTTYTTYQSILYQLNEGVVEASNELRTANSLTGLFLPQFNAKLQSYWQIFKQRLYNLRHHLTIDGQPLSLTIYAAPANPAALLTAAVVTAQGSNALPQAIMPLYRFWVILEIAKSAIAQLIQFGTSFQNIIEKQDAETLSELLQTQGGALVLQSIKVQEQTIQEIEADQTVLQERLKGAQVRFDSWSDRYEENINRGEEKAMDLYFGSSVTSTTGKALYMSAAALDLAPNIYGFAVGGSRYGALFNATGIGVEIAASATRIAADKISQSEIYRRRREEWESQRNNTEYEIKEIEAQLDSLTIRHEAAKLQKEYLEIQQSQTQEQLELLQSKFTNKSLYNWLRGKLSAIYYQYYIQVVSRCLMAEQAYCYEQNEKAASFIKPGAWQGTYGGLLAGETLLLNLAQMEKAYLEKDERALEVSRTVSFAEVYANLEKDYAFNFSEKVQIFLTSSSPQVGNDRNNLSLNKQNSLIAMVNLADLKIREDYPAELGAVRRIKQVSVTLPALVGPYQDVQAMLSYGGSVSMPRGCRAIAISQGMNDSGQFVLDFNDGKYLPFEGIPIDDESSLNITFPQAKDKQADLLKSLTDIILHIRYTIRS